MARLVRETFTYNTTWTAPAGVKYVIAHGIRNGAALGATATAIDSFNRGFTWGNNNNGQLGDGTTTARSSPVAVLGGLSFVQLMTGSFLGCGLTTTGVAYGWGQGGTTGDGTTTARSSPVAMVGGLLFSRLVATPSRQSGFAFTTTGVLYGWGVNNVGQLGNNATTTASSPTAVAGGLTFVDVQFSDAQVSVLGKTSSGAAYGWGPNAFGQLGDGTTTGRSSPTAVLGGLTFTSIYCMEAHSAGLTSDGSLYMWGYNSFGQLGDGTTTARSSPVAVVGGLKFSKIAIASNNGVNTSVIGLTKTGQAYGWGFNSFGECGLGNTTAHSSPVALSGGLTFVDVTSNLGASNPFFFLRTADGTLYTTGDNSTGQLGVGDTTNRSSPTAVLGGLKFAYVYPTYSTYSLAATPNGNLYAWGVNSIGNLGVGDTTPRSSPVAVVGGFLTYMNITNADLRVTVIPGTTYNINPQQFNAQFGPYTLGQGPLESITLEYVL